MPYLGNRPDNIVIRNAQQEFNYTATSSQTTFTGLDTNNNTLAYNPGNVEVFFNGARLEEADFTATNGTSIVLASAAATNDLISVVSTDVFEVTDTVSKANGGTFGSNVTVSGLLTADNISTGGYIRGPSSLTIDPATHGDNTGTVIIAGDLTVNGTTTQVSSNEVNIGDNILKLNSDETGTPSQNAGIEVERGTSTNVAFRWNETTDKWQFTNDGSSYIDLGESDLVGDTTPQLGGNLDTNSKNIVFGDSSGATVNRLAFGASSDLQIYHDGNSKIADVGGGKLELHSDGTGVFIQKGATEYMAKFETDGAVTLYYDNSPKLATISTGVQVTSDGVGIKLDGTANTTRSLFFRNTTTANPAEIYADGSLRIRTEDASTDIIFNNNSTGTNNETMRIKAGGNVGIGISSPGTSLHVKDAITNPNTISSNMTIPASSNSMMAGPITLNATLTIPSGSSWTIV